MKISRLIAIFLWCTFVSVSADQARESEAKQIADLYQTGISALRAGQRETAKRAFQGVLKLQPGHGHARYQLATLDQNYDRVMIKKRELEFENTKLKEVFFDKATLAEALEAISKMSAEASNDQFSPSFVVQDPDQKFGDRRISLQLRNVPVSVVLNFVLDMVKGTARYDEHATVITPRPGLQRLENREKGTSEESEIEESEE